MLLKNTAANTLSQSLNPLLAIFLTPFYIYHLGLEGYGLIGFFSVLTIALGIFSKGLRNTLQREFSLREGRTDDQPTLRRLLRTFEIVYWGIGALLAVVLVGFSGFISIEWLQVSTIAPDAVRLCLMLLALRIAITFPNSVYNSLFNSTQAQVLRSTIEIVSALVNALVCFIVVLLWQSIVGFYLANVVIACATTIVLRLYTERVLPSREASEPARFHLADVRNLWRLAAGFTWIGGISLLIGQMDRFIISALLPISILGVYTAATAGGRILKMLGLPFLSAVYPQLCQAAGKQKLALVSDYVIRDARVMNTISLTIGLPISFFAAEILQVWTHNATIFEQGSLVMALYVFGNLFQLHAATLYQVQAALGKVRYHIWFNTSLLFWFTPLVWVLIHQMELVGAALAWVIYGLVAWGYHTIITMLVALPDKKLGAYYSALALPAVAGVGTMVATHALADIAFPELILGRLLCAVVGAGFTFTLCYLFSFGLHIPHELKPLVRHVFPRLP